MKHSTTLYDTHLTGIGTYVPSSSVSSTDIARRSGIPEPVVREKMGISEKHVCDPDEDHVTDMSVAAAEEALDDAGVAADALDLVLYHGSEYKDYVVWSAAAAISDRLGCTESYAYESHSLCAGAPVALRHVITQLRTGDVRRALLVTASREEDLIDYSNENSSFMFNFGSGASAMVLESTAIEDAGDRARATVLESDSVTDGSFSGDVIMPAGGSKQPPTHETVEANDHTLDVPEPASMKERLAEVTLSNFLTVADGALERSGFTRDDVDFVALTHMKRSFHEQLTDELGVGTEGSYYLDDYGHVQSADQIIALQEGLQRGRVEAGDLVLFLAAGTGYTWAATVLRWNDEGGVN